MEKTEVVILTKKRFPTLRPISIGELTIESKTAVKYLGLILDSMMSFFKQIKAAVAKATAGVSALIRLMANLRGRTSTRRCLLIGADALDKEVNRKRLA